MRKFLFRPLCFGLCGLLAMGLWSPLPAAETLPPPFGLQWGDPPSRLVEWATRTELDQLVKTPAREPRLKVFMFSAPEGALPDHEASMLEARFMDGRLFEVTLHYSYPGKSAEFVRGKFTTLRGLLTRRHGPFKPSGLTKGAAQDGIATHSTAYRIDPSASRHVMLALTEVVDETRGDAAARFSVLYHNAEVLRGSGAPIVIRRDGVEIPAGPVDSSLSESPPGDRDSN